MGDSVHTIPVTPKDLAEYMADEKDAEFEAKLARKSRAQRFALEAIEQVMEGAEVSGGLEVEIRADGTAVAEVCWRDLRRGFVEVSRSGEVRWAP